MRALALFSGGLDSSLAIKMVQNQGIEVIALNFVSYFFGGKNERADKAAKDLGVKIEYIDFKEIHKEIVLNPPSGYGKNMNPCIDCHALMIKVAGSLMEKYGASFIITGEVLGQRPMSQNSQALKRVEKLSGLEGYLVRPLSAKIMPVTIPEEKGWLDRSKLGDLNGRGRIRQMELAEKMGVIDYPSPGGGCLLTDPGYSKRLKILKQDGMFEKIELFDLIKTGRFYRIESGKYLIVARDEGHNKKLPEYFEKSSFNISSGKTAGPTIVGIGKFSEEDIYTAKELFARYSKTKGNGKTYLKYNGKEESIEEIDHEKIEKFMKKYQIL